MMGGQVMQLNVLETSSLSLKSQTELSKLNKITIHVCDFTI